MRALGIALVFVAACSAPAPEPDATAGSEYTTAASAGACTLGTEVDTRSWTLIEDRGFSFRLPPGFVEQDIQPIDSHVREWSDGAGGFLSFDYGWYSSTLEEFATNAEHSRCDVTIGGRAGIAAMARGFAEDPRSEDGWVVGVSWRNVSGDATQPNHLTMHGVAPDLERAALVMAAIRSVQFSARP